MKRTLSEYMGIGVKGLAMGLVEPLPGISGGTVAFVTGVYEEFLGTIKGAFPALKQLLGKKPFVQRIADFWAAVNGNFIVALGAGMGVGVVSIVKVANYMRMNHTSLFAAFIFGLIVASIVLVYKKVEKWTWVCYLLALVGFGLASQLPVQSLLPIQSLEGDVPLIPLGYMFIYSCVAACAFLLPGTSGSFFLVILGAYGTLLDSIDKFLVPYLAVIGAGMLTGMVAFSSFLSWLLKRYHDWTVAMMTGFIVGSLRIIWPWKAGVAPDVRNVLPQMDAAFVWAVLACVVGVAIVLGIDFAAKRLKDGN